MMTGTNAPAQQGSMSPMMMPGMMPVMMPNMMMGMMPMMMPVGCRMTLEMGKDAILCKIAPEPGMSMDALRERCESMMKMMAMGMPIMLGAGGMTLMGQQNR